jgi:hypothetical protein
MRYQNDRFAKVRLGTGVDALLGRIGKNLQVRNEGVSFVGHALLTRRAAGGSSRIRIAGEESHAEAGSGKCLSDAARGKSVNNS